MKKLTSAAEWRCDQCQIRSYLLAHLAPDTQSVYLYHGEQQRILDRLREEGINSQGLINQGRLQTAACSDSYLLGGHFDTGRMLDIVTDTINRYSTGSITKLLSSCPCLRLTTSMLAGG